MEYPPVIILGMHRSGTSMLVEMLEKLGIFLGVKKEINNEAIFFLRLNEWILRQANVTWDNPYNFKFINNIFKKETVKVIDYHLKGLTRIDFLGLKLFLKYHDIRKLDIPWGWKDPRNTFTIDIWKEVFSKAKILHIFRNPIDVAESLRKRELEIQRNFKGIKKVTGIRIRLATKIGFQDSLRTQNLHECIKLWEEYVTKAISLNESFGQRILHIKYEEFLDNPEEFLSKILQFINVDVKYESIIKVINKVKKDRRYAFLNNRDLIQIYSEIKGNNLMQILGYNHIK